MYRRFLVASLRRGFLVFLLFCLGWAAPSRSPDGSHKVERTVRGVFILSARGERVEFVYKDFPLSEIHPWAMHAAVNANCLATQNNDAYWDFADYVHSNQKEFNSQKGDAAQYGALDHLTLEQGQKHSVDITKLQA